MTNSKFEIVPMDVPSDKIKDYIYNFNEITCGTGSMILFDGDARMGRMYAEFNGKWIHTDASDPEHLFKIANHAEIGVFSTQLGMMARYGLDYRNVKYLVSLNSKTKYNLAADQDFFNQALVDIEQVIDFKQNSGLNIVGVGYTVYFGSKNEPDLLREAAQIVQKAHEHGLIVVLKLKAAGLQLAQQNQESFIYDIAGVAACLGGDFAIVDLPKTKKDLKRIITKIIKAAGRTKIVCKDDSQIEKEKFLDSIYLQAQSGVNGIAVGPNFYQKGLLDAIKLSNAVAAIILKNKSVKESLGLLK